MDIATMLVKIKENPKDLDYLLKALKGSVGAVEYEEIIYTIWSMRKLEERRAGALKTAVPQGSSW